MKTMKDSKDSVLPSGNGSPLTMVTKKKEFQVIRLSSEFSPNLGKPHNDEVLYDLLQNLRAASCVEDQMDVVKKVSSHLIKMDLEGSKDTDMEYVRLAVDLYLSAPLKHPAKYALVKTFNGVKQHAKDTAVSHLREGLRKRILTAMNSEDLQDIIISSTGLLSCSENFVLGNEVLDNMILDILQFLEKGLQLCYAYLRDQNTPMFKVEVSKIAHTISRIIISTLQRTESSLKICENEKYQLNSILGMSIKLLNNSEVPLDTRTNFGFVIVLILECLQGPCGWMKLLGGEDILEIKDDLSQLCICSGLLSSLKGHQFELVHATRKKTVISSILDVALLINKRCVQESSLVLGLWRVMQQLTRVLTMHTNLVSYLEVSQVEDLLKHVWGLLDHYMDTIRHLARAILENIMQLKDHFLLIGIDLGNKMSEAILQIPETKRSRYVILSTMTTHLSTNEIRTRIPCVIDNLLMALQCPTISSHVSGAFVAMAASDFKNLPYEEWSKVWIMPLFDAMEKCNSSEVPALEDTLSKIIKLCPSIISEVLPKAKSEQQLHLPKLRILLTCLKIGRKLGMLSSKYNESCETWFGILPNSILLSAMSDGCDEIRLSALALIVETNRSTETLCLADFEFLKQFLTYNINCEVPSVRQQTLAFMTKLLHRIRDSAHSLTRITMQKQSENQKTENLNLKQNYEDFVNWLIPFCCNNLKVGSNYSRRFSSLKILTLVLDVLKTGMLQADSCQTQLYTDQNALLLLGIILIDTFEENKEMATKILAIFPCNILGLEDDKRLFNLFQNGCFLASSIHPSDCMSAAYLIEVCCHFYLKYPFCTVQKPSDENRPLDILNALLLLKMQLEREMNIAKKDIFLAASSAPMYGTLFCIRHLMHLVTDFNTLEDISSWQALVKSLVDLCFKLDDIVSPVVNSSSPEGHLPMDFNEGSSLLNAQPSPVKVTAQMILLCSWRTVKEVSLFLGKLSDCCPILPDTNGLLCEDQVLSIGSHLILLLEETKHRGAFEQAYVGFSLLAARLWRHPKQHLQELPNKWLSELMNAIQSNEHTLNKLCATRRSAGVPFLVQAIVSAEIQTGASLQCLQPTMSQLLACAADKEKHLECRTHALNILRALYRHAPLAEHIAPYISEGVIVAVSGFRGKTWAVRNSATLLFSSLMTRIFGVRRSREELSSRNKMTGRVFFHRYPELYEFLLTELEKAVKSLDLGNVAELAVVHPILLLIARLYPSSLEGTDTPMQLNTFVPLVRQCASNSVLKTRVLAAKAVVPLITANVFIKYLDDLMQQILSSSSENLAHGLALQAVYLLRSSSNINGDQLSQLNDNLQSWMSKLLQRLNLFCSYPVRDVLLQIVELFLEFRYGSIPTSSWELLTEILRNDIFSLKPSRYSLSVGQNIFEVRAARVLLQVSVLCYKSSLELTILELLRHMSYEVVQETLVALERLMIEDVHVIKEDVEDILPDVVESERHWVQRLPANIILTFRSIMQNSLQIGQMLASLVSTSDEIRGRLALYALVHVTPSYWCSNIDLKQLVLWYGSPHEGTSVAALACFSSLLQYLVESNEDVPDICEEGCKLLKLFCVEERSVISRMGAVDFLLQHRSALDGKYNFLCEETVSELWLNAIKLICDDNSQVRLRAALLSQLRSVTQRSLETLLDNFVAVMQGSPSQCLATLLALGLGPLPDISNFGADEERVFEKGEINMFIEYEILSDLISKLIETHALRGVKLSGVQWKWIWTKIGGWDTPNISTADGLFDAIHQHNALGLSNADSNFLLPVPVVCSLRRLCKVELVYYGETKVNQLECFPFNVDKLFQNNVI